MLDEEFEFDAELMEAVTALAASCASRSLRVAVAESCTGGWLAHCCTELPGSSNWFECGWVVYSNQSKQELLGVNPERIERHGAVSCEVVEAMAHGALERCGADLVCAISGVAGPDGGTEKTPVGRVCFAFAERDSLSSEQQDFSGDRTAVRRQAVLHALWRMGGKQAVLAT